MLGAFVSLCEVEQSPLDERISSRGQIAHQTCALLPEVFAQHGIP
ncbi:hypothetical protein [Bradyrhizobium jicamae]|nr:hypothetical protein [Bradyrhizobium jicamae]